MYAREFEESRIRIPISKRFLQHVRIFFDGAGVPAVPENERPEDILPVIGNALNKDLLVYLGGQAVVFFVEFGMTAFFQPVAVLFQEFGFPGRVVAGIVECQYRLVKGLDILLELCVQAVPQLPVAGGRYIDISVPGPVEIPGETFLGGDAFDLLEDFHGLLGPVGPVGGFVILPELAHLRVVPCVFRAIVFHCYRSCK